MIVNAKSNGGDGEYILADIDSYNSSEKFDVIHSMEVLYYLKNPKDILKKIADTWLNKGGRLIAGIDLYHENDRISFMGRKSRYSYAYAKRSRMASNV